MGELEERIEDFLHFREFAQNRTKETLHNDKSKLGVYSNYIKINKIDWKNPTEEEILHFLSSYNGQSFNVYLTHISVFYKWHLNIDEKPEFLKRLKYRSPKDLKRNGSLIKKENRIINPEEYEKLIKATPNIRNKSFIEILYHTGIRRGEILSLTNKSIQIQNDGLTLIVVWQSKTQSRKIPIPTQNLPYTEEYFFNYYPYKDRKEEYPFFYSPKNPKKSLHRSYPLLMLEKICKNAGLTKQISPHDFRHTAITRDCNSAMPHSLIEVKYGLVKGSQQFETYDHTDFKNVADYVRSKNEDMTPTTRSQLQKQNQDIKDQYEKRLEQLENRIEKCSELFKIFTKTDYKPDPERIDYLDSLDYGFEPENKEK